MIKDRTGEVYTFSDGRTMEIIEYFSARNITIKFNDGTVMKNVKYYRFTDGSIKNSNVSFVYGVGYFGYGKNISEINGKSNIIYSKWSKMIQRCYSDAYHKLKPTYKDCSVHPDWHNFQVFAEWANKNYIEGFELDKDILVKGNKVYSVETCCFVPREINNLFTHNKKNNRILPIGVYMHKEKFRSYMNTNGKLNLIGYYFTVEDAFNAYKTAKEKNIKNVANKYKAEITPECYNALMNWTININD
jgi:hypothetical protein